MPIEIRYVETGITYENWHDKVTLEEVEEGTHESIRIVDEHGDAVYVDIVDLSRCKQIPFDLLSLQRLAKADPRAIAIVVIQPSQAAKVMAGMLRQVTHMPFALANSYDEGLATARNMLRQRH